MIRDWQCLYSTLGDSPERLQSLPQHLNSSSLSHVFTYIAQEVAERLQPSHHFPVNRDSNLDETIAKRCCDSDSEVLASLRASAVATSGASAQIPGDSSEPEYRQIIKENK